MGVKTTVGGPLASSRRHVAMGDVDAAGILYFAAPYRWHEELLTGWWKTIGHPLSDMLRSDHGCPSVSSVARYSRPLTVDDEIALALYPSRIGRTSFAVTTVVTQVDDGAVAVDASSWHVWTKFGDPRVPGGIQSRPLPDWLRTGLAAAPLTEPAAPHRSPSPNGLTGLRGND
jgi:acyl-CoA thioesterase FadM